LVLAVLVVEVLETTAVVPAAQVSPVVTVTVLALATARVRTRRKTPCRLRRRECRGFLANAPLFTHSQSTEDASTVTRR
jgi:hypothetical protein